MSNCGHTFAWYGIVPPSHCPNCGACLGCGAPYRPMPYQPWGVRPWPGHRPLYTSTSTSTGTLMNTGLQV